MIYFIRATISGHVKIGFTAGDPAKRLAQLQTATHEPLELLGSIPGGLAEEQQLHKAFATCHVRGEWFRGEPELMAEIESMFAPTDSPGNLGQGRYMAMAMIKEGAVQCPSCGDTSIFLGSASVGNGLGGDKAAWEGQGQLLIIPFRGACGCEWELCFGMHKSITRTFIRFKFDCREFVYDGVAHEADMIDLFGAPIF